MGDVCVMRPPVSSAGAEAHLLALAHRLLQLGVLILPHARDQARASKQRPEKRLERHRALTGGL